VKESTISLGRGLYTKNIYKKEKEIYVNRSYGKEKNNSDLHRNQLGTTLTHKPYGRSLSAHQQG
jgi:hypothetical protein